MSSKSIIVSGGKKHKNKEDCIMENRLSLKVNLRWSEVQSVIMLTGLPSGTAGQIYNNNLSEEERELYIEKVINKEIEEYEGTISYEKAVEAFRLGMSLVVVGPFLKEKERKKFLKDISDVKCAKVALFDAIPYEVCRPNGVKATAEFEAYKKCLSLPLLSEGFSQIKVNALPNNTLPDYYQSENYINRFSKEIIPKLLSDAHIAARTVLQVQYLKNKDNLFQEALTLFGAFYLNSGKESSIRFNGDEKEFPYFHNISALDFYSYASEYLDLFEDARYKENDLYNMAVAIQLHVDNRIKTIIEGETEESDKARKELNRKYTETIIDSAVLLRKSVMYAEEHLDEYIKSYDGDEYADDAVFKSMTNAWEYILEVLKIEAEAVSKKNKLRFEI